MHFAESLKKTNNVQAKLSEKALVESGFNLEDFPSFKAPSIGSDGKIDNGAKQVIPLSSKNVGQGQTLISESSLSGDLMKIEGTGKYTKGACETDGGVIIMKRGVDFCFVSIRRVNSSLYGVPLGIKDCTGDVVESDNYCMEPIVK